MTHAAYEETLIGLSRRGIGRKQAAQIMGLSTHYVTHLCQKYGIQLAGHQPYREGLGQQDNYTGKVPESTQARPGTEEKIAVLSGRIRRGEKLHAPGDAHLFNLADEYEVDDYVKRAFRKSVKCTKYEARH